MSILLFGLLTLCSPFALAQQETATITGEVRDANGGAVPKATITVTNVGTNINVRSETNEQGSYTVPNLRPGNYTVTVEKQGFSRTIRSGLTLQVNQVARVDIAMKISGVEETVEISGGAPLLESETSSRGAVIDQKKIVDLPLNGRDYNQLALLSPGVLSGTPRMASIGFKGAINVNGNRLFMNVFLLDGVDNISYSNSFRGDNVQVVQPSIEALQEFKIQTNAYSAEFGRSAGAVVNATIKSGTNNFHGSVYEFLRNDALDASNFFANLTASQTGLGKPPRKRNQFGGAIGGPIVKNKTFLFGDYEGLRDREGVVRFSTVPSLLQKQGIFNAAVFDPFTPGRPAFAKDAQGRWVIPSSRFDPVGKKIVDLLPDPNFSGLANYVAIPVTRTRQDQFDVRIDHNFNSSLNLFGRYSFVDSNLFRPGPLPGLADGSFNDAFGTGDSRSQGIAVGLNWTINPQMTADIRFGHSRGDYFVFPPNFGVNVAEQVGLKNVPNDPEIVGGLPKISMQGFSAFGRHTSTPQFQTPRTWDFKGSLSHLSGRHFMKYGGELLFVETGIRDINALIGSMVFNNNLFTSSSIGDLLLGLPTQLTLTSNSVFNQSQRLQFLYVQDDFKVSQRLTLNLGLRYEYATPVVEDDNQFSNFDPLTGVVTTAKDGSLFERALVHPDRNNFAPRFGFAYSPTDRWVFRGAYGVFYNHTDRQGREGLLGFNPPFLIDNTIIVPNSNQPQSAGAAIFRLQDGYPSGLLTPANTSTLSRRAVDQNRRTGYVQQWNFGIQREIFKDLLFEVAYVGNKGTKLAGFRNANQRSIVINANGTASAGPRPFPQFGDIQYLEDRVLSNYNSMQVRVEKRYSKGLTFLGSYTFGKALTLSPDHLPTSGVGAGVDIGIFREPQNPNNLRAERGLAEFDVKQRAVVSYVWEIPFGKGRAYGKGVSGLGELLFGGWNVTGIHTFQSGLGLTAVQTGNGVLNLGTERRGRPFLIGEPQINSDNPDCYIVDPRNVACGGGTAAFVALDPSNPASPVKGIVFGSSGVGVMRGPGLVNFDFTFAKNFNVTETKYFQFRTELFNAFNHTNLGIPDLNVANATFGTIRVTATPARIIQFALKFYF
jgi:hypothetical protein